MFIYEHCLTVSTPHYPYVVQAWAFASGVRVVMGKSPLMNMDSFPYEVWNLHRKLFHRFLKYRKYFVKATLALPEYNQVPAAKRAPVSKKPVTPAATSDEGHHVISLLSSSEEERKRSVRSLRPVMPTTMRTALKKKMCRP